MTAAADEWLSHARDDINRIKSAHGIIFLFVLLVAYTMLSAYLQVEEAKRYEAEMNDVVGKRAWDRMGSFYTYHLDRLEGSEWALNARNDITEATWPEAYIGEEIRPRARMCSIVARLTEAKAPQGHECPRRSERNSGSPSLSGSPIRYAGWVLREYASNLHSIYEKHRRNTQFDALDRDTLLGLLNIMDFQHCVDQSLLRQGLRSARQRARRILKSCAPRGPTDVRDCLALEQGLELNENFPALDVSGPTLGDGLPHRGSWLEPSEADALRKELNKWTSSPSWARRGPATPDADLTSTPERPVTTYAELWAEQAKAHQKTQAIVEGIVIRMPVLDVSMGAGIAWRCGAMLNLGLLVYLLSLVGRVGEGISRYRQLAPQPDAELLQAVCAGIPFVPATRLSPTFQVLALISPALVSAMLAYVIGSSFEPKLPTASCWLTLLVAALLAVLARIYAIRTARLAQ